MTEYVVHDGYRALSFDGDLLAKSSSRRRWKWRWTDLALYRTGTGVYILAKVGESRVMHIPQCSDVIDDLPRFQELYPGSDPDDDEFQYHECVPDIYDFPGLLVEKPRSWAEVSSDPQTIIRGLLKYRQGTQTLTRTGAALLDQAADVDSKIREVYVSTHIRIA